MTDNRGRVVSPWANRQSILSVWEQIMDGASNFETTETGLFLGNLGMVSFPVPISRSFRITRYSLYVSRSNTGPQTGRIDIYKSEQCSSIGVVKVTVPFAIPAETTTFCICGRLDPTVEYLACLHFWTARVVFDTAVTAPRVRLALNFEAK